MARKIISDCTKVFFIGKIIICAPIFWRDIGAGGVRVEAFQQALFGKAGKARLSDRYQFSFNPSVYPARWSFAGRYSFRKHFYPLPGELKPEIEREETACAIQIDELEEVQFWIRNLEPHHWRSMGRRKR